MMRNVKLKKFLVNNIFPVFSLINRILPKDKRKILIYCANDELIDNSEAVYDYLVENGYYKKYKILCSVKNPDKYTSPHPESIMFISKIGGIVQYMFSGYMFYSMGKIPIKPTKKQMVVNMSHGIPLKAIYKLSNLDNGEEFFFTYLCATSEFYRPIMAKAFGCPEENVCICGEPKTDKLFMKKDQSSGEKMIVWAPTFRQSAYLGYDDSSEADFLPFVKNSNWTELNDVLRSAGVKLVAKLHPLQDLNGFTEAVYSNLEIYSDKLFRQHGYDLYELLSRSDALLADYSSVYLEYLVLNRPIGFTLSDIDEYTNKRGFLFENPLDYMPGKKIYSEKELYEFIEDIAGGVDEYEAEREKVNDLANYYRDGRNCERVLKIAGITMP